VDSVRVLYQDDYLLVISKPSGLVVNRALSVKGLTLQDWVEDNFSFSDQEDKVFLSRSGIVHRLDKDTSGLMVLAKKSKTFFALQSLFKQKQVVKKYLALVHGRLEPFKGDIRMPLARFTKDRKKFSVCLGGRTAITKYQRLSVYQKDDNFYSLINVGLETGRTHQIRVHLSSIGYPLVSDPIYLGIKRLNQDNKWCPRLFLHSFFLGFIHPVKNKPIEVKIDLPGDLKKAVKNLGDSL